MPIYIVHIILFLIAVCALLFSFQPINLSKLFAAAQLCCVQSHGDKVSNHFAFYFGKIIGLPLCTPYYSFLLISRGQNILPMHPNYKKSIESIQLLFIYNFKPEIVLYKKVYTWFFYGLTTMKGISVEGNLE